MGFQGHPACLSRFWEAPRGLCGLPNGGRNQISNGGSRNHQVVDVWFVGF